jgi:uncharacterized protein YwlG (UPF0340 family)
VVSLVKLQEPEHLDKALTVEQRALRQRRSAALVVVVQVQRVQLAMAARASAAMVPLN